MRLNVVLLDGERLTIEAQPSDTIHTIRSVIEQTNKQTSLINRLLYCYKSFNVACFPRR